MSHLSDIQKAFRSGLLNEDVKNLLLFLDHEDDEGQARFQIYKRNYMISLNGVLAAAFPVLQEMIGPQNFAVASRAFTKLYPPEKAHLSSYGGQFGIFLKTFRPAQGLPFLADLARLEWARIESYFAPSKSVLSAEDIKSIAIDHYDNLKLRLHPATRLVDSDYAIDRLWHEKAMPTEDAHFYELDQKQTLLITRHHSTIVQREISSADKVLIEALEQDLPLVQAAESALHVDPDFDLMQALASHLSTSTFESLPTLRSSQKNKKTGD